MPQFILRLQSVSSMIGFDARMDDRGGFASNGKVFPPKNKEAEDAISGISSHGGFVTKPMEAFILLVAPQFNGNNLSALHFELSNFGRDNINSVKFDMLAGSIKEHVRITPDYCHTHAHMFLRDESGMPIAKPKNISHQSPWCEIASHTSTKSSTGAIGRVIRRVAFYHKPWEFVLPVTIGSDAPSWLTETYLTGLYKIAGKMVGIGAGRTMAFGDTTRNAHGRFIVKKEEANAA